MKEMMEVKGEGRLEEAQDRKQRKKEREKERKEERERERKKEKKRQKEREVSCLGEQEEWIDYTIEG